MGCAFGLHRMALLCCELVCGVGEVAAHCKLDPHFLFCKVRRIRGSSELFGLLALSGGEEPRQPLVHLD